MRFAPIFQGRDLARHANQRLLRAVVELVPRFVVRSILGGLGNSGAHTPRCPIGELQRHPLRPHTNAHVEAFDDQRFNHVDLARIGDDPGRRVRCLPRGARGGFAVGLINRGRPAFPQVGEVDRLLDCDPAPRLYPMPNQLGVSLVHLMILHCSALSACAFSIFCRNSSG